MSFWVEFAARMAGLILGLAIAIPVMGWAYDFYSWKVPAISVSACSAIVAAILIFAP